MSAMKGKVFIDTNVFVYAKLKNADLIKHDKAKALLISMY
jgi:predicted nucleic acid-binding protein